VLSRALSTSFVSAVDEVPETAWTTSANAVDEALADPSTSFP
jgi:hypothetical protein